MFRSISIVFFHDLHLVIVILIFLSGSIVVFTRDLTIHLFYRSLDPQQIPYILMIAASIVLLGSVFGSAKNQAYGISVAVITGVTAGTVVFLLGSMKATWATIGIVSLLD